MKARTIGISLLSLAMVGMTLAQDTAKPAAPAAPAAEKKAAPKGVRIAVETSMGNFVLELNEEKAPITCANFIKYVKEKYFDDTIVHRVESSFVIQAGGFDSKGEQKKTHPPIKNEASNGLKNLRGTISMARTNDPNSATSQFFINLKDNPNLEPGGFPGSAGYAVFGKVVEGMEVIDKIKAVKVGSKVLKSRLPNGELFDNPMRNVPVEPVVIKSARILSK